MDIHLGTGQTVNQILYVVAIPIVIAMIAYSIHRGRAGRSWLLLTPFAIALGSAWALGPDFTRILGMADLYNKLSCDPRCDIFLWHYTIDQRETDSIGFGIGYVLLFASLLFVAWRELQRREEGRPPHV